jgi:hypothetical protein
MEKLQGNSYVATFMSNKQKMLCFSFDLFSFFFYKSREQEGRKGPAQWEEGGGRERG